MKNELLRNLPSVDALIGRIDVQKLIEFFGREAVLDAVRGALDDTRAAILRTDTPTPTPDDSQSSPLQKDTDSPTIVDLASPDSIVDLAAAALERKFSPSLRRAINATGILMHSGLGRAVLSEAARAALDEVSIGYCTLALDIETGRRGQRDGHVSSLLRELTGAEAATICNNNCAATILVLNTMARGKEVILSRGQLVEIGGSFRMPEVMAMSGAILREVGTTNKTHLRDYAEAIGPNTGAILRVHHSNYRILGFHSEPSIEELTALGRERGLPVIDDLGSGALVDLKAYGLASEPLVRVSVAAGVDLACFSGDKLIGGPQSGLIVGKAEPIARIKKNPLARAFRCGKLNLAAMEATLKLFLAPEKLEERHPIYRMLSIPITELERRGKRTAKTLAKILLPPEFEIAVVDGESQIGSGAVPVETIPTKLLSVRVRDMNAEEIGRRLRRQKPAVFTRIHDGALLFDFRTIHPDEDRLMIDAVLALFRDGR